MEIWTIFLGMWKATSAIQRCATPSCLISPLQISETAELFVRHFLTHARYFSRPGKPFGRIIALSFCPVQRKSFALKQTSKTIKPHTFSTLDVKDRKKKISAVVKGSKKWVKMWNIKKSLKNNHFSLDVVLMRFLSKIMLTIRGVITHRLLRHYKIWKILY